MRLGWRDAVAGVLLGVVVVVYALYVTSGDVLQVQTAGGATLFGIQDATGMAALGLAFGLLGAFIGRWVAWSERGPARYLRAGVGVLSLTLGVLALVGENLFGADAWNAVLAAFIGSAVLLWGMAMIRRLGVLERRPPVRAWRRPT